ncbi:hypothetical protein QA601_13200 [Chitinispirillales bacterium ANBcel5]|uniref:hypothetical protein n=1 Tax=Cellulosispirillum alkaliphilum TaxID=3039283 RepID=UPI002A55C8F2|nr:hypothetical protein [Chitinispirillales bacterium ANBcel5]
MKLLTLLSAVFFAASTLYATSSLEGVWCSSDGLVLDFSCQDSVFFSSTQEESLRGEGTYESTDSTICAVVLNEDLEIKMSYNYKWKDEEAIKAMPIIFSINGEEVSIPSEWIEMIRCDKEEEKQEAVH